MSKKAKNYISADEQDETRIKEFALSDVAAFKNLVGYLLKHKWGYSLSLLLIFSASGLMMLSARLMGSLVDEGILKLDKAASIKFAIYYLIIEGIYIFFHWAGRYLITLKSSQVIFNIREALFHKLQELPISYFDKQPQGRVVTRVTHDVEELDRFFTQSMARLLVSFFMMFMSIFAMLVTDFKLGIYLSLMIIPALVFIYFSKNWVRKVNRRMSKASSATNSKLSELISGLEVIRSFGKESWSKVEYDEVVDEYLNSSISANKLYAWTRPLISFLCSLPIIGLVGLGIPAVMKGALSVGLFVTFIRYTERFFHSIMMVANEFHVVQQAFTCAERVNSFLSEKEEDDVFVSAKVQTEVHSLEGDIEFKNITMSYDGENDVLKDISFHIKPGERIGLVGTTGSGKTTTISLISRLYEYQNGDIYLDGTDIRNISRKSLRKQIGLVSQDVVIIKGTLRENLKLDGLFDDEHILRACSKTGLAKVMSQIPLSLDSDLLEGGSNISVGQRQLIALTRILLKDPSILVLDEATANIDPEMEKIIQSAVDIVMKDRTCLMIAHRLASLEKCDRLLVFEDGYLAEQGQRESLMNLRGRFWNLYSSSEFSN